MWSFQAFCDEFYVSTRLYLKLELSPSREAVMHFFEQIRKANPTINRFRRRDDGGLMLDEEEREGGQRRFVRVDADSIRTGSYNPTDADEVDRFSTLVLDVAPPLLSLSDLDYDYLEVLFGFDLEFSGNHDELVADALFFDHPLTAALSPVAKKVIECQPLAGVALSDDCAQQAYIEIKSRTSTGEVRTGDYDATALSVLLTARRYWGFGGPCEPAKAHRELLEVAAKLSSERVVPLLIKPLAQAIASRR